MLRNVAGLSRAELEVLMPGQPRFRAKQLFEASLRPLAANLADSGAISLYSPIMSMTSLPLSLREDLASRMRVDWGEASIQQSKLDGTLKLLVKLPTENKNGLEHFVETVVIPSAVVEAPALPATDGDELATFGSPGAVCVSSQVGCSFACRFCRTGTQSMSHKLSAGEIVGQVMLAQAAITHQQRQHAQAQAPLADSGEGASTAAAPSRVRSVVFMGQGEPLMNWPNVRDAIGVLTDNKGPMAFSPRRVTVSTVGVAPRIPLVADTGARLALSLHSGLDETRTRIMPTNARFPVEQVQRACVEYLSRARSSRGEGSGAQWPQASSHHRHWSRISLEVTLLRGVNDSLSTDADSIARFAHGLGDGGSHVNLIPFNAWPGAKLQPSSKHRLLRFAERLRELGVPTTIRATRGRDVLAACGQLHSEQRA
jgi:23S rRNA (adenine2503-C2)-methyltransferase